MGGKTVSLILGGKPDFELWAVKLCWLTGGKNDGWQNLGLQNFRWPNCCSLKNQFKRWLVHFEVWFISQEKLLFVTNDRQRLRDFWKEHYCPAKNHTTLHEHVLLVTFSTVLPEKISKMFLPHKLGFIDVLSTVIDRFGHKRH